MPEQADYAAMNEVYKKVCLRNLLSFSFSLLLCVIFSILVFVFLECEIRREEKRSVLYESELLLTLIVWVDHAGSQTTASVCVCEGLARWCEGRD